jgi:hypothetical protein
MLAAGSTTGARAAAGTTTRQSPSAIAAAAARRRPAAVRCRASSSDEPAPAATTASTTTTSRRAALLLVPAAAAAVPLLFTPGRAAADDEVADAANNAAAAVEAGSSSTSSTSTSSTSSVATAPNVGAATFTDIDEPTLAYSFRLPASTAKGEPLSLVPSRRPERYSSAAPLSADARQRIVAEWLDLKRFVSVTVTVGPAASPFLRGKAPSEWRPREVAEAVLTDRSTGRLSSGQRTTMTDVERAAADDARPAPTGRAWTYEYLSQGSPTVAERGRETYRHAVAVSAARYGDDKSAAPFLWSVSFTCPERLWPDLEGPFKAAAASFALTEPTAKYVAPDRDPWRFF